ncbi:mRNA-decapping enzyme [Chloropicon primus]|uniref:mRNA-decapping enzyme n=1 Tax=Chloropicon primus TaxID=1764295 RepID=A0A5B8MLN5_9CHLO|nr:mRNA-decapping enzyme [Chloropicon primus]UPQ99469.1 mRNA-decapping enzyme [Chloropicon primus]|eukprot:QDZ20260.1 mRNA-decapping enzyme [Chloropicon primus]
MGPGESQSLVNKSESEKLVLASLRRNDDSIEEVLETANHVCLYEFIVNLSQWKRREVEGTLFIVKRSTHPRFQLIILNRRSQSNHVEDIVLGREDFERSGPYVLYKNNKHEVLGIWFYEEKESEKIFKFLKKISLAFVMDDEEGGKSTGLPREAIGKIHNVGDNAAGAPGSEKKSTAAEEISDLLGMLDTNKAKAKEEGHKAQKTKDKKKTSSAVDKKQSSDKADAGNGARRARGGITRADLKTALQRVVRREEFVDLLYEEILNASSS